MLSFMVTATDRLARYKFTFRSGARVCEVVPGGAAESVGVRVNDVIVEVEGRELAFF